MNREGRDARLFLVLRKRDVEILLFPRRVGHGRPVGKNGVERHDPALPFDQEHLVEGERAHAPVVRLQLPRMKGLQLLLTPIVHLEVLRGEHHALVPLNGGRNVVGRRNHANTELRKSPVRLGDRAPGLRAEGAPESPFG